MRRGLICGAALGLGLAALPAGAQEALEEVLCAAAKEGQVVELVYEGDAAKGCAPRILDVHQTAVGKNGLFYLHGWQSRGCTKGRDYASKRIFKFEKIVSAEPVEGAFSDKSVAAKKEGWDGCIGSNCFIDKMLCE